MRASEPHFSPEKTKICSPLISICKSRLIETFRTWLGFLNRVALVSLVFTFHLTRHEWDLLPPPRHDSNFHLRKSSQMWKKKEEREEEEKFINFLRYQRCYVFLRSVFKILCCHLFPFTVEEDFSIRFKRSKNAKRSEKKSSRVYEGSKIRPVRLFRELTDIIKNREWKAQGAQSLFGRNLKGKFKRKQKLILIWSNEQFYLLKCLGRID